MVQTCNTGACTRRLLITGGGSLAEFEAFFGPGWFSLAAVQPPLGRGANPGCLCEEERQAWPSPTRYGNGSRVSTRRIATSAAPAAVSPLATPQPRRCGRSRHRAHG